MAEQEHAGDIAKQRALVSIVGSVFHGQHHIDVMGCLQSLMVRVLVSIAKDEDSAIKGLRACFGDMRETIRRHYKHERSSARNTDETSKAN